MPAVARALIDLDALRHNFALARGCAPESRIMAVIKADGYGHGLLPVAHALATAEAFALARPEEALQLRAAGLRQRLVLLGTLLDRELLRECAREDVDVVVHDDHSAAQVTQFEAEAGVGLNLWLKVDTGMHRLGLSPQQLRPLHARLATLPWVRSIGHMSHLACAEWEDPAPTLRQLRCMEAARGDLQAPLSLANSAGLIAHPQSHGDWVRPGIMLYGDNPVADRFPLDLRPVMHLSAPVLAVRDLPAGAAVGYGETWRCQRPTRLATIGIGYGDGYPRHAPNGTPVSLGGRRAALAGRVSMDSITVDVTDCPGVVVGMEAELWGARVPVAEVAALAGTISYALLTGVTRRVPRVYRGGTPGADGSAGIRRD